MDNEERNEQNKAAAAREARRRRILENGNNRLGKITGRVHDEIPLIDLEQTSNGIYPDPEFERDVYEPTEIRGGQDPDIMEMLRLMQGNPLDPMGPQQPPVPVQPETTYSKCIKSPLPIVFIALFTYIAFALDIQSMFGGHVFSFFVVWELLAFTMTAFVFRESSANQLSSIIALLPLFLPRLNTQLIQITLKVFTFFNKLLRDIAVFLFTFIATYVTYNFYRGHSINRILDSEFNRIFEKDI